MRHSAQLEQTVEVMARCADILRHLAEAQEKEARRRIDDVADLMEEAADRLADLVKPPAVQ